MSLDKLVRLREELKITNDSLIVADDKRILICTNEKVVMLGHILNLMKKVNKVKKIKDVEICRSQKKIYLEFRYMVD